MDISDVKRNMNRVVNYKGSTDTYMLTGCIIRREINDGDFWYQAELSDINAGSLLYDRLENISEVTE